MLKALSSIERLRPVGPLPLVTFEEGDLGDMDKLEASLDDLMNLEMATGVGNGVSFPTHGTLPVKINFFPEHPLNMRDGFMAATPHKPKKSKRRADALLDSKIDEVNSPQTKGYKKKRSRKQHNWTHQDIMELILIWGEVQLEPSDGVHKWQCIYNKYKLKHEWASLSCIQSYFKAKVKCAYNCKLVYDYIVSQKTFPKEADKWIYLLPRNKPPKKGAKSTSR